jgi:preprotein translocase subunit SecG
MKKVFAILAVAFLATGVAFAADGGKKKKKKKCAQKECCKKAATTTAKAGCTKSTATM